MDIHDMLAKSLLRQDSQRDRSKQVALGPSAIGGCSRRVWHDLKQTPKTNTDTDSLAAIMGTFIHAGIAEAIVREDPFGDNFLIEHWVPAPEGAPIVGGHIDLFIRDKGAVIDWKTTKMKSLRYFPNNAQRYQVHTYGWLMEQQGETVNTVSLVAIPRDGEMKDVKVFTEEYSREYAEEGLAWLANIVKIADTNAPAPEPEEKIFFCSRYCGYYDETGEVGCPSTRK